jgi:hypothetical protein
MPGEKAAHLKIEREAEFVRVRSNLVFQGDASINFQGW